MYAIWCFDVGDYLMELPSKVDDGGVAFLCFEYKWQAERRAAKHYGYGDYKQAKSDGYCQVVRVGSKPKCPPKL